jgi:hypothetical protein
MALLTELARAAVFAAKENNAKPAGVQGAESDPAQYQFAALDTATPYLLHHNPADGGKLAHYLLRWMNTRN